MNRVERHNEPYRDDSRRRTFSHMGSARFLACAVVILMATWTPSVLADAQVYGYVGPTESGETSPMYRQMSLSQQFAARPGITVVWEIKNLSKQSSVRLSSTAFNRPCSLR